MNTKQQTAVEWLEEQLQQAILTHGRITVKYLKIHTKRAKAIEKKQITDCCVHTTQSCWTSLMDEIGKPLVFTDEDLKNQNLEAEQYYSQTFGGDNDN